MKGVGYMDTFVCDYACRSVGEGITKHNIPNDWCAEFDAYDNICPIICIQVDQIRKVPAIMDLKLRIVENENDEYAGCMIYADRNTVVFKVNYMNDLLNAMETFAVCNPD